MLDMEIRYVKAGIDRGTFFVRADYRSRDWYIYEFDAGSGNLLDNFEVPPAIVKVIENELLKTRCRRYNRRFCYRR